MNAQDIGKAVARNWATLAGIAFLASLAYQPIETWLHARERAAVESQRREAIEQVSMDAEATAMVLWNAQQACKRIDVSTVADCSRFDGPLPQERAARTTAEAAMNKRASYKAACLKVQGEEYCEHLLDRALRLRGNQR